MGVTIHSSTSPCGNDPEKLRERLDEIQPVSYTHLDVYKRQVERDDGGGTEQLRPLDRLQGGGDGSSLGIKRHGRVRPFQVMSRGPIAPALAGSPLVGVLRMETHIPVLLP